MPSEDNQRWQRAESVWRDALRTGAESVGNTSMPFIQSSVVCVGSGCSQVIAKLIEMRMNDLGSRVSRCCTPYEFTRSGMRPDIAFLASSKGKHLDAIDCYEDMLQRGGLIVVFTTDLTSPLALLASRDPSRTLVVAPRVRNFQECFIPLESTIAMAALVALFPVPVASETHRIERLFEQALTDDEASSHSLPSLRGVNCFHILTSFWGYAAALDLQTRVTESGCGIGLIVDPWDIAHGKYMSIQSQKSSQLLVTLNVDGEEVDIETILESLPDEFDSFSISAPLSGLSGAIYCVFRTMLLVSRIRDSRGMRDGSLINPRWGAELFEKRSRLP